MFLRVKFPRVFTKNWLFNAAVCSAALSNHMTRLFTSSPVLRLLGGRDQARDGGGHLPAQLPVLLGSDPGLCGDGAFDLSGGWGPGSDVLFKPDVIRGLPVLLPLRGLPAAPA